MELCPRPVALEQFSFGHRLLDHKRGLHLRCTQWATIVNAIKADSSTGGSDVKQSSDSFIG